ncbi:hypothetical protein NL503_29595, partial [Klebsiella pneumoniae]|nr:hypothetical protein [Klebsiella pneumoniae]
NAAAAAMAAAANSNFAFRTHSLSPNAAMGSVVSASSPVLHEQSVSPGIIQLSPVYVAEGRAEPCMISPSR